MLIPIGKRLLVKPVELEYGTLIVKNSKPTQFIVHQIGDEVSKVANGDVIYLDKFVGHELEHEKEKFIVLDESQILAKVQKES